MKFKINSLSESKDLKAIARKDASSIAELQLSSVVVEGNYVKQFLNIVKGRIATFDEFISNKSLIANLSPYTRVFIDDKGVPRQPGFYLRNDQGELKKLKEPVQWPQKSKSSERIYIGPSVSTLESNTAIISISKSLNDNYFELTRSTYWKGKIAYIKVDATAESAILLRKTLSNKTDNLRKHMNFSPIETQQQSSDKIKPSTESINKRGFWKTEAGLKEAKDMLLQFQKNNDGRNPYAVELKKLLGAFIMAQNRRGKTMAEIRQMLNIPQVVVFSKPHKKYSWISEEGVEKAKLRIKKFIDENQREPNSTEQYKILGPFFSAQRLNGRTSNEIKQLLGLPQTNRKEYLFRDKIKREEVSKMLDMRFKLGKGFFEIGKKFNMNRQKVARIINKALLQRNQ